MTENNTDSSSSNKEPFKFRPWNPSPKLYIGNLGEKADKYEIEKIFQKFGPVKNVWIAKAQPGFAFIEFEDPSITERVSNEIYGVSSDSRGVSGSSKSRHSQSLKNPLAIKVPTEDRPGDWLCPSQTCTNVNFSWREFCNKCETRNPAVKETKEERRRRIYGNNNDNFRAVTSYANRGQRSRGRGSQESTDRQGYHGHSNNGRENHRYNGREIHRDNGRENHRDNGRENHRYNGRENHRGNLRGKTFALGTFRGRPSRNMGYNPRYHSQGRGSERNYTPNLTYVPIQRD